MDLVKKFEKIYIGKKVQGYDFTITAAGINGAVKEFGEAAVDEFFCNGTIATKGTGDGGQGIGKRTVVDSLRENAGGEKIRDQKSEIKNG